MLWCFFVFLRPYQATISTLCFVFFFAVTAKAYFLTFGDNFTWRVFVNKFDYLEAQQTEISKKKMTSSNSFQSLRRPTV